MDTIALHPDLKRHLQPMPGFGQALKHPLVFSVPYFGDAENERLNKYYEHQRQRLDDAIATKNHFKYIFTHERPYRVDALLELEGEITTAAFNPLILEVFIDSENIAENTDVWEHLFDDLTGTDPWDTLKLLPEEPFTIYRGGHIQGFSWTTDIELAKWFANRWGKKEPVWKATVSNGDVIGFYNGRKESEVIVYPPAMLHLIEEDPVA